MMLMLRKGERRRRSGPFRAERLSVPVAIRLATEADARELERLAELDSSRLPPAPYLVAVCRGRIEALVSLTSGEELANPFERTADLRALLRCHAGLATAEREELRARPVPVQAALATG